MRSITSKDSRILLPSHRRGAMLVLVVLMIFGFIATAAFSVDVAYMQLVKSEMRSANDAAAKAAAEELASTQNQALATQKGILIAQRNFVANQPYRLSASDFQYGNSSQQDNGKFLFTPGARPLNAVRVDGLQRAQSASGAIRLFFGRIMGREDFSPSETSVVTFLARDIVLVVDRSGSMTQDNKIGGLRAAISDFLEILDDSQIQERVGLASYATDATADLAISSNLDAVRTFIANMPVDGRTNISGGIDAGRSLFTSLRSDVLNERTMIVLTDGIQNEGRPAQVAATEAASQGITIHTITFGENADQQRMRQVAAIGNGQFFQADNNAELRQVFSDIASTFTTVITE